MTSQCSIAWIDRYVAKPFGDSGHEWSRRIEPVERFRPRGRPAHFLGSRISVSGCPGDGTQRGAMAARSMALFRSRLLQLRNRLQQTRKRLTSEERQDEPARRHQSSDRCTSEKAARSNRHSRSCRSHSGRTPPRAGLRGPEQRTARADKERHIGGAETHPPNTPRPRLDNSVSSSTSRTQGAGPEPRARAEEKVRHRPPVPAPNHSNSHLASSVACLVSHPIVAAAAPTGRAPPRPSFSIRLDVSERLEIIRGWTCAL